MNPILIRNEAKPDVKEKSVTVVKSSVDVQRLKVEKLMKNPDKPAYIPEPRKSWKPKTAPEFVRDVMGSSAGAGSGEFHVYRHIRRREYNRQAYLNKEEKRQKLDSEYADKLDEYKIAAEMATAKRRAKRQRKKKNRLRNQVASNKKSVCERRDNTSGNEELDCSTNDRKPGFNNNETTS